MYAPGVGFWTIYEGKEIPCEYVESIPADVMGLKEVFLYDIREDPSWWFVWPLQSEHFNINESDFKEYDSEKMYIYSLGRKIESIKISAYHKYHKNYFVYVSFDMTDYNENEAYIYSIKPYPIECDPIFATDDAYYFLSSHTSSETIN